jgi:feruloyl esterase
MPMIRTVAPALALALLCTAAVPTIARPQAAPVAASCGAALARFTLPGHDLKIEKAERIAASAPGTVRANPMAPPVAVVIPAYCKVEGVIDARTGVGGKPYGLRFALALPEQWNGRFLFQGGGGLNGTVNLPLGANAAGDTPALARGFAVVSTDSGHQSPAVFDATFFADQRATVDFSLNSVPTVTRAAKAMIAAFYGRPAAHSYWSGCSTGGREGMMASQRYPELFDGIVVGAPAMRTGHSNIGMAHAAVMFNQAAPRDAQGLPLVADIFSKADRAVIADGLLAQCDALDGLKDGVIDNVKACRFAPAKLQCAAGKTEGCLSAAQTRAMTTAFEAPHDASGRAIYAAYPYDTGITSEGPGIPGFLPTGGSGIFGPPRRDLTLDLDAMVDQVRGDGQQMLTDTNVWTNLGTFVGHGGKILFYHGVSDPWFSAWDTLDYWQRAAKANPGWGAASRFYMVPGMGHCGGGANTFDSFDLLGAVVNWVEKGEAPGAVTAQRRAPLPAARPMCPWPAYPNYVGGNADAPGSFQCRAAD